MKQLARMLAATCAVAFGVGAIPPPARALGEDDLAGTRL
jgi:hypothetical protein